LALKGFAWRYKGTRMALCEHCHGFTKCPGDREFIPTSDLIEESDVRIQRRRHLAGGKA